MLELTVKGIESALLSFCEEEFELASFGEFINYGDKGHSWDVPGLGEVVIVDCQNYDHNKNYDGWIEDTWIVFSILGKLYKATGTHTSFTGSEWDDTLKEVKPKQKVVVEYEETE